MWISDYTIAMLLFIIAALISVKILINSFNTNTAFEELKDDAVKISETFLSEGYPVNWTNESAIRPGLLTGNRLDQAKVLHAMNNSYLNYTALKSKLQAKHDFLVIFQNRYNDMVEFNDELCKIGYPSIVINYTTPAPGITNCTNPIFASISYDNMIKLTRLSVYNSDIVRMVVYVWD
ncbi:hypothetical protein JW756_04640 [Candidatus Woesearchaeota archaeon]|nr:hypothetical protein [Candidatus Woesearchaeota archaeon]